MKVRFSEGLAEVTVEGVSEPVKRGETVTVTDEVGKQLCKQGWEQVGNTKKADSSASSKEKE